MSRGGSYRSLQPRPKPCGGCGAPVFWVVNTATGKHLPCDIAESDVGDVVILQDGIHADVLDSESARAWVGRKYRIHFATCPLTRGYRRKRGIPEPRQEAPRAR